MNLSQQKANITMIHAKQAQENVESYFTKGYRESEEWLAIVLKDISQAVDKASSSGKTQYNYEANFGDEPFGLARTAMLQTTLESHGFAVSVELKEKCDARGVMRANFTIFHITWNNGMTSESTKYEPTSDTK